MLVNVVDGMRSWGTKFLEHQGENKEAAETLIIEAMHQYQDPKWQMYMNM